MKKKLKQPSPPKKEFNLSTIVIGYKEQHLVEKYFLKRRGFRYIVTHYDKLVFIYGGMPCFNPNLDKIIKSS